MAPKLYTTPASPPARAVLMAAKTLGVKLELENVDLMEKQHLTPEFLKINPQHTVPTLEDGDFIIWDSHAIMGYLVNHYGKDDSLYPKDAKRRAIIDQRMHYISSIFYVLKTVFRKIMFHGETKIESEEQAIHETYDLVEKLLQNSKWIAGNDLSIADFSYIGHLSSLAAIVPIEKAKYPKLSAYLQQAEGLPCYEENRPGVELFGNLLKNKLAS